MYVLVAASVSRSGDWAKWENDHTDKQTGLDALISERVYPHAPSTIPMTVLCRSKSKSTTSKDRYTDFAEHTRQ